MGTTVIGTGVALGEHLVPNEALGRVCDTTDAWIFERTGIRERYYVKRGTATSDLAVRAGRAALDDAGVTTGDIDYLIVATMTPDYYFPGTATLVQHKLGLDTIPALDIRQQCTGFIHGMQLADSLLRSGACRRVLLIGAEVHSGFMPFDVDIVTGESDRVATEEERALATGFRDRTVIFGDGAGAVVVERSDSPERDVLGTVLHTDGSQYDKLYVPSGFAFRPYITAEMVREGRHVPEMDGHRVFRAAAHRLPEVVRELLAKTGHSLPDIELLLSHQANIRICNAVQNTLHLPDDRVYNNIERYGNTTAATIPILWHESRRAGRARPGELVCLLGFGAGFVWGATLLRA